MADPITDADRETVRRLHVEGKSRNQIARETGRSAVTVSKRRRARPRIQRRGARRRSHRGATTAIILGRVVHLVGASDARAEGRLRGLTASLAYCDEITGLPTAAPADRREAQDLTVDAHMYDPGAL
ncbi:MULTISPECIES: helix-turn-helix domain-containing protein [Streptomyces]|uniref:Helix-turn-helix domain-containing protein n=1 Tax=Streptomyces flavovirens TaxID=52258 RepID=A0ABV8NBQ0_9ACTN|nr:MULTISPECIES: helix-turn-helix domain-containing protein [unclassified Streptomyces]